MAIGTRMAMASFAGERVFMASGARLALGVDGHRGAGSIRGLHAMLYAARLVRDIPVMGSAARRDILATSNGVRAPVGVIAPDIGTDGRPGDCTARGRDVIAAPAADLVAEDTAKDSAHDRAGNVRAALRGLLLLLDRAALLGRSVDGTHRSHLGFVQALVATRIVVVDLDGRRCVVVVVNALVLVDQPHRGNSIVQSDG